MVSILALVLGTIVVTAFGGAIGYVIWLKTRPTKETWKAKVYQLGEGIREPEIDEHGKILTPIKLQDIIPYSKDVLEKIYKAPGIIVFRLQKLNRTTPAVEGDCVEFWGDKDKEVSVLLLKSGCTLMKKGYNKEIGEMVFSPLPHSRINLIKGEMAIRKDRLRQEKDILQAITPWIVVGICMMGLIAITYLTISGFIEISKHMEEASMQVSKSCPIITQPTPTPLGRQEPPEPEDEIPIIEEPIV